MKKDLRGRAALRQSAELAPLADAPAFETLDVADLRKLAELIRDYASGDIAGVSIETAGAFGGTSRHRFQCALRALRALAGDNHPATRAVDAAKRRLQHSRPRGQRSSDHRPREVILAAAHWTSFRDLAGTGTMPLMQLRAVDRFLAFCARHGRHGGEVADFIDFVADQKSSMLLRTLRDGLEHLLTAAHPAVFNAETARSRKEAERLARVRPAKGRRTGNAPTVSVPYAALPADWRHMLDRLRTGKRVRGRKQAPKSVDNMTTAARQLVWAARNAGLSDALSLATVRAYDRALEARATRATSRHILFTALGTLAFFLGSDDDLRADLRDLAAYYERRSLAHVKVKEGRLADLPDLKRIFEKANKLLDDAATTRDRARQTTLYVDAAALAFLSLIPLRNADTRLCWGRHIIYIGEDDPAAWGLEAHDAPLHYYLDLRTSKRDEALAGPLAPILTPFLDAVLLRGRDARLLDQIRREAMATRAPVFPKSTGAARSVSGLSARWRAQLGTGASISRTRIHELLGALGEEGVRAALALCAQASPRTAAWYQPRALAARQMRESQEMIDALIDEAVTGEGEAIEFPGPGALSGLWTGFPDASGLDKTTLR